MSARWRGRLSRAVFEDRSIDVDELLFNKYDIYSVVENQKLETRKAVDALKPNDVLTTSEDDLVQDLVAKLTLHVPVINEEDIHVAEAGETKVDVRHDIRRPFLDRSEPCYVPGNMVVIAVPFAGDAGFFQVQPQAFTLSPPRAKVQGSELRLTYVRTDHDGAAVKQEYTRAVTEIQEGLRNLRSSTNTFNAELEPLVRSLVKKRKERLLADAGMVSALGLPIKKRHDAPTTYAVPMHRKRAEVTRPQRTTAPFAPEPTIDVQIYEEILRIISSMVHVMEQSPRAFQDMGEEDLRTHFLVQLNGQYDGQATGETFNYQGKTDILIRADGKNVFIAECKVWHGEKEFQDAIDQLLSYLCWRDTKAAILVFNRNANFTNVLEKIAATAPAHACYKKTLHQKGETAFRYVFHQPADKNREITLTVMAFDVPTAR